MSFMDQIETVTEELPNYRKEQLYRAIYKSAYDSWQKETALPLTLRDQLSRTLPLEIDSKLFYSKDERTIKALIRLSDDSHIETVLIRSKTRNTVCVSSQVGCPLKCTFCASGQAGLKRNLTIGEIVDQIILFTRLLKTSDDKVTNIVFMGMGEPFLNYQNVIDAIRLLNQKNTLHLSTRRFSISTCGIIPGIKKLANEDGLAVNLAVSIHSADNKKRAKLMPINKKYGLGPLARELNAYFKKTKRKILFEYILLKDINTFREDAQALRTFINAIEAAYTVNLNTFNEASCDFEPPTYFEIQNFKEYLTNLGINFTQRSPFGKDISAACGQLVSKR